MAELPRRSNRLNRPLRREDYIYETASGSSDNGEGLQQCTDFSQNAVVFRDSVINQRTSSSWSVLNNLPNIISDNFFNNKPGLQLDVT